MKTLRMSVRMGEESHRVCKKWEKNYYKNIKAVRGVEGRWVTYI
jgi:hypothetical protein